MVRAGLFAKGDRPTVLPHFPSKHLPVKCHAMINYDTIRLLFSVFFFVDLYADDG